MKKYLVLVVAFLAASSLFAQIPVTFHCDMSVQIAEGNFDAASGMIVIRGNFQSDAGDPGGDWQGNFFQLIDDNTDQIYDLTVNFPDSTDGNNYEFKFVMDEAWEGADNRPFTVATGGVDLPVYYFNDDDVIDIINVNTLKFRADITDIAGTGLGYFDPATDSILVMGLDWDGLGTVLSGDRRLVQNLLEPGSRWETEMTFQGPDGDSTKWKFKAYPDEKFSNTGWETGDDRWHVYEADGWSGETDWIVPRITPLGAPLATDQPVLFRVNLNNNPLNTYDNSPIPLDQLEFIGLKGADSVLGAWAGDWVPADTTTGQMVVCHDDGTFGDEVAGDNVWSRLVYFTAGTLEGIVEFKYGAWYPDASTISGGTSPMDNEGGFGLNHPLDLKQTHGVLNTYIDWGAMNTPLSIRELPEIAPVEFDLSQNYPNPFNPTTTIRYTIPEAGMVNMKVYNLLGEEVLTLVNMQQDAGAFEVTFNASHMASGLYFYTLSSGTFTMTKKMMLMK